LTAHNALVGGSSAKKPAIGGHLRVGEPSTSSEQTSENHRFDLGEDFGSRHTADSLIPVVVDLIAHLLDGCSSPAV
jgi:hypothetical protein